MNTDPRKILFIVVTRIGDTLFTTPAIKAVADAYPNGKIAVYAHPKRQHVFINLPFIHQLSSITKVSCLIRGWLFPKEFDLAFIYGHDIALIKYGLRASKLTIAFQQKEDWLNQKLFRSVTPPKHNTIHAVHRALLLPRSIEIKTNNFRLSYSPTSREIFAANQILFNNQTHNQRPLVALKIASFPTKPYRNWPMINFFLTCKEILKEYPTAHFLILGGPDETETPKELKGLLSTKATLFSGESALDLRGLGALLSLVDLYIGVDTGPTHIMSAFNIPMIVMYHCASPAKIYGPLQHPCANLIQHTTQKKICKEESSLSEVSQQDIIPIALKSLAKFRSHPHDQNHPH
jgi:heptosyltransferase-3